MEKTLFYKIKGKCEKVIDWIGIIFFSMIFIIALFQIIMRWVLNSPVTWSEELIRFMYVWICFIGWTIASRNGSHIKINAIYKNLSENVQKVVETFNCTIVCVFGVLMVKYGINMTIIGRKGRGVTIPISFDWVYVIAPIASAIIIFYKVLELISIWKKKPDDKVAKV